jgi:sRNA-binding regulator protein Hfq
MEAMMTYFKTHKNKTSMKIFLDSGTMLQGKITDYDEKTIVLDKCLVFLDKVISISPRD